MFGFGYPVTLGALQPGLAGGTIDVGISTWDATGSTLLWSTDLGGIQNESPHSLVVNDAGELFVLGKQHGIERLPHHGGLLRQQLREAPR